MGRLKELQLVGKAGKSSPLVFVVKVDVGFSQSIARAAQYHALEFPDSEKTRAGTVSGGK